MTEEKIEQIQEDNFAGTTSEVICLENKILKLQKRLKIAMKTIDQSKLTEEEKEILFSEN